MAQIITIANQKGGVGKTATANALTDYLKKEGYNTLMVDTDPQCNTSALYDAKIEKQATLYDLLTKDAHVHEAIQNTSYGDIIACDPQLAKADAILLDYGREYILREAIEPIKEKYDFIFFDTSPSLGVLLFNALVASDGVIIPICADSDSLQGIINLSNTINAVQKHSNRELKILGLLVTMLFSNTTLSKDIINEALPKIEKATNSKAYKTKIRYTTKVKEAKAKKVSLYEYAPDCTAALDYSEIAKEIIREGHNGG